MLKIEGPKGKSGKANDLQNAHDEVITAGQWAVVESIATLGATILQGFVYVQPQSIPSSNLDHVLVGRNEQMGRMGHVLTGANADPGEPPWLRYEREEKGLAGAKVRLGALLPPS